MKVVVIGAGLGGLATALRLQGQGAEVTVVEQRERPGGRAYQKQDQGFTWDTGPSLLTMPWVLEETFAAGGLDLHREVEMLRLDPFYRIFWAGEERHLDFVADREAMRTEIARFSARDAAALDGFLAALRPIYEEGILDAGRRPFLRARDLAAFTPRMVRLGAARPLSQFVARHFEHPRVREAFSFHSLFIGGDPQRVPAIYGALVYLQFLDGVWYTRGGTYALIEAMARTLDVRCGERVARIEHRAGEVTGVVLEGGERIAADAVVSNTDVLRTHELTGLRAPVRPMRASMSCFLLYLGTNRPFDKLLHHTLLVGGGYREFIRDVTRSGRLATTFSTYLHAPARTEPEMAAPGGDSLAILLPVPNKMRGRVDWERDGERLRDALMTDLETTFGLTGLDAAVRVEHRMTPDDFERELGAAWGNAFATEPTLHQSAYFRQHNRDDRLAGLYHVGGGTHPGAGIPGVLLGAEITGGLVASDHPSPVVAGR
ncbi:MAG: phytoene desaturase [Solirubrobacterales bacterium]|nr:phytoene desaturase [Solirubrobacterales bacterium]